MLVSNEVNNFIFRLRHPGVPAFHFDVSLTSIQLQLVSNVILGVKFNRNKLEKVIPGKIRY